MEELLNRINYLVANNKKFAVATVTSTWGSAPRPIGSMMLIAEDGTMSGSVSGGCVEGAIVRLSADILRENTPKLVNFGVSDDEAWSVGLSCGGSIEVFIEPFLAAAEPEMWAILRGCLTENKGAVLLTQLNNSINKHVLILPNGELINDKNALINSNNNALISNKNALIDSNNNALINDKNALIDSNNNALINEDFLINNALDSFQKRKNNKLETPNEGQWFVHVFPPKHHLVIIGAAHITVDLVHLAHYFGFETTVIDPRGIFAHKTDFPTPPNALHVDWPAEILPEIPLNAYTYAVLLTHDPKIDDQALHLLLRSEVAYIGALGSKKTHEKRLKRLYEAGFTEGACAKINAPVGVHIQAKSAREIALSIIGALIKAKNEYL
jgi:xanthine dehydrogenase accessory factor